MNEETARHRKNYAGIQSYTGDTCEEEIQAFIGLQYVSTVRKDNHPSLDDVWRTHYG
jgi:hypothetical protein